MLKRILKDPRNLYNNAGFLPIIKRNSSHTLNSEFEPVFSFPFIRYIAVVNRLKVYQILGTSLAVPGCGILETFNAVPSGTLMIASYIGITATAVISLGTLPLRNTIGFIYLSKDNKTIKISFMDFWGRRKDKLVPVDDWVPLLDLSSNIMEPLYLSPQLSDGTKYKLFLKFGKVLNTKKMGEVLE